MDTRLAGQTMKDCVVTWNQLTDILIRMADWHGINNGHDNRVMELSILIGEEYGLNSEQLTWLKHGALLHDIGRVGIDDDILKKTGRLTAGDWGAIRTHPDIGYQIIKNIYPKEVAETVLYHHENWDGTGYPKGLRQKKIPLNARIVSICDEWDALRNKRPYREALEFERALEIMNLETNYFDPQIYAIFLKIIKKGRDELD